MLGLCATICSGTNKFLVGRDGTVLARFGSRTKPDDNELTAALKRALAASE
jgi:glutathione peroxidase